MSNPTFKSSVIEGLKTMFLYLLFCGGMVALFLGLVGLFGGCDSNDRSPKTGRSTVQEMEETEQNQQRLIKAVPPPILTDSQERRNLVKRLELTNNPNRISYIHLLANDGRIIFYSTVKGKVTSLRAGLTTEEQVITTQIPECNNQYACFNQNVVESPDFDGAYGENQAGIFWFAEDGTMMEWNGSYFLSDRPMRLTQEPVMVMQVNGQGNAVTPTTTPIAPDTVH